MNIENIIEAKLHAGLEISQLHIENESHMHSGPATNSHFKVIIVAQDFAEKRLLQRHQLVYALLSEEMQNPIHALSLHLFTAAEWQARVGQVAASPTCKGGSK